MQLLKPGGKMLLMCPNYSFPYESYYNIPVIINKNITYKVFSRYISNNNKKYMCWDCNSCWDSINWINYKSIKHLCFQEKYNLYFDKSVLKRIIERLSYDNSLQERKGYLAKILNFLNGLNLFYYYSFLPESFQPYMKLILKNNS